MSEQHKPLTVAGIEELKELEEKATPGPWAFGPYSDENKYGVGVVMDENDEPIVGLDETQVGIVVESVAPEVEGHHNAALIVAMRNNLPCLLSLLTPPTDAELREAVESAESLLAQVEPGKYCVWEWPLRILLRVVQAPRLTGEQEEAIKEVAVFIKHYGCEEDYKKLCAAFPDVCAFLEART